MVKNLVANAGDGGSIPGKTLWRRKWQLQDSCLKNPMDREERVAKSQIQLSD